MGRTLGRRRRLPPTPEDLATLCPPRSNDDPESRSHRSALDVKAKLALALALGAATAAALLKARRARPSPVSHLILGRRWEYDVRTPSGVSEASTTVLASLRGEDGRKTFRIEYHKGEMLVDQVCGEDALGRLVTFAQDQVTFDPPLVVMPELQVGKSWHCSSTMVTFDGDRLPRPIESSGRVVRQEAVTVPAGTFAGAYRVEYENNGVPCTCWMVSGLGMVREVAGTEEMVLARLLESTSRDPAPRGAIPSKT